LACSLGLLSWPLELTLRHQYRGEKNVQGDKSWETVVLEDFTELRQAGLTHPLIDEIEIKFTARE